MQGLGEAYACFDHACFHDVLRLLCFGSFCYLFASVPLAGKTKAATEGKDEAAVPCQGLFSYCLFRCAPKFVVSVHKLRLFEHVHLSDVFKYASMCSSLCVVLRFVHARQGKILKVSAINLLAASGQRSKRQLHTTALPD